IGRLSVNTQQQLFLAESIHPAVPMDIKKTRSWGLSFVGDQEQRRNRLYTVQVKDYSFEGIAVMFLSFQDLWRRWTVLPWQVAKQAPQFFSPALLICNKLLMGRFGFIAAESPHF